MEFSESTKLEFIYSQFKKSLALSKKNILIYYNKGPVVITGFLFPVILYFAFSMNRIIEPIYITSGLLAMAILLTASSVGPIVLPWETQLKTIERIIASPITITTLLFGDIWASFLFGLIVSIVPIIISVILGLNLISPLILPIALVLGCFCFACFGILLSTPPTDMPSNVMILTILIKFPLLFISPVFVPIESVPWTVFSPLTYFIDLVNFSYSGKSYFGPLGILVDIVILIAWTTCFLIIGISVHKKTISKRFRD